MDKQLRVFEVKMHILCSVLGCACVTLMNTISFLCTEGFFKFFLSLRGWIVVGSCGMASKPASTVRV